MGELREERYAWRDTQRLPAKPGGREVKNIVKAVFEEKCVAGMENESSLEVYRKEKEFRGVAEGLYDNSRASG